MKKKLHSSTCRFFLEIMYSIADGTLYVACDKNTGLRGLYAGIDIPKNALVTSYGGIKKPKSEFVGCTLEEKSHCIALKEKDCYYVLDGKEYSNYFPSSPSPSHPHLLPILAPNKIIFNTIINDGAGYLCNHDSKNPNLKLVYKAKNNLESVPYLQAKKDIKKHEPLVWNYKNEESRRQFQ